MKNNSSLKFKTNAEKQKNDVIKNKDSQHTIPFLELYDNGMMLLERNKKSEKYAMIYRFSDANYQGLAETTQIKKIEIYKSIFNALSPDIQYQELCINVPVQQKQILDVITPTDVQERYKDDEYAAEYFNNQKNFIKNIASSVSAKDFYFILSYEKKSKLDIPHNILIQAGEKIKEKLQLIGSSCSRLDLTEILELLHKFYNPFDEEEFKIPENLQARGIKIRDYIAPTAFNFKSQYIEMGEAYSKCFYAWEFADDLDDGFIQKLLQNQFKIAVSKQITHIDKSIAIKQINKRMKELEEDRQNRNIKNKREGTDYIPFELQEEINSCIEMQKKIKSSEELFDVGIYIIISAKTLEELEEITKIIKGVCREFLITIKPASLRQEDALNSIAPFANDKLKLTQYFYTQSLGVSLPFTFNDNFTQHGFFYGKSVSTGTAIIIDRLSDINSNGFILGKSGSGKSLYAKLEIHDVYYLLPEDRVLVIDPEREFIPLCNKLGGQVVEISVDTPHHVNPFDLDIDEFNNEGSAIRGKTELIESLMGVFKGVDLTASEKSIIDRSVQLVYSDLIKSNFDKSKMPTFKEFYDIIKAQPDEQAKDLLLYLERYVFGSVDIFAHQTNIDINNRLVVFDINKLTGNLRQAGMLIMLDLVWKSVLKNSSKGIRTWTYADEFQIYYDDDGKNGASKVFENIWARCRKYGAVTTALTQNISKVVASKEAYSMLQNSQCVTLLEQAKGNVDIVKDLYSLSDEQASRLIAPKKGEGIIISKNTAIPFERNYPDKNAIYEVITTKFSDKQAAMGK